MRGLASLFVGLTAWHLKYLDRILVKQAYSIFCASGYHFLGRGARGFATDRELIERFECMNKRELAPEAA